MNRERWAVWLVSWAHGISHYYQLLLIPLFPLIREQWGISYVQLGIVLLAWNLTSAAAQTPAGFLVDRVGSRNLLIVALIVAALAFTAAGIMPSYVMLIVAAAIGGVVNSVYHPADYDLLHHNVAPQRMGRAFAIHAFLGYVGYAVAPAIVLGLNAAFGLRWALVGGASFGALPAIALLLTPQLDARRAVSVAGIASAAPLGVRALLSPAIVGLTIFYMLITMAFTGLQNFSIPALQQLDGMPLSLASTALTVYLAGSAIGVLIGGVMADKTSRHEDIAFGGFIATAVILVAIGLVHLGSYSIIALMAIGGIFSGILYPSRDMLVRKAAPAGAIGRTFGIVTTGFNVAGLAAPLMYGWIMDRNEPRMLFLVSAAWTVATAIAPLLVERRRKREATGDLVAPQAARVAEA